MAETGVAFSGGGIRSAAFCSGVLRRLLQRNTKIDYLSCVSGGGYTGTAYLDWKYRNGKKDDPKWHQEFFDYMRENAGLMCNWQKPFKGILDTVILLSLMILVCVIIPIIVYGPYLFPLTYVVDYLFGDFLRAADECDNSTSQATLSAEQKPPKPCKLEAGSKVHNRVTMFATLVALFIIFYFLAKKVRRFRGVLHLVYSFSGLLFACTFIPYFIYYFLDRTSHFLQSLAFLLSIVVWIFFPVLRSRSSLVVIVYWYSYAIYWKVYELRVFNLDYSDSLYYRLLFGSGFVLWIVPALGALQQRLVYVFNR